MIPTGQLLSTVPSTRKKAATNKLGCSHSFMGNNVREQNTILSAINYYEDFASQYDSKSAEYHWYSPQIMFGLLFDLIPPEPRVLDVGIGTGLSSVLFKKIGASIVGLDGSSQMLRRCKEKGITSELYRLNIERDVFPPLEKKFDVVISNGVFYFFRNVKHPFLECAHKVRRGGYLSINFESTRDAVYEEYENYSNASIQESPVGTTGVVTYRHNPRLFEIVARAARMKELRRTKHYAYTSPQTGQEVFFTLIVWQKE